MSDYCAITQRLRLNKDVTLPADLQEFFDHVVSKDNAFLSKVFPTATDMADFKEAHTGFAPGFSHWRSHGLMPTKARGTEYWAFSGTQKDVGNLYLKYFTFLRPYLALTDGEIVYRQLFEYSDHEDVIFWDARRGVFVTGFGHRFTRKADATSARPTHPIIGTMIGGAFAWAWNYGDIPGNKFR